MRKLTWTKETVGPAHDPYGRDYYTMRTDQRRELLQSSSLVGVVVPVEMDLVKVVPEVKITLVSCALAGEYLEVNDTVVVSGQPRQLWESLVGLSLERFETYHERLHGMPSRCRECGGELDSTRGYVGETILWCTEPGCNFAWSDPGEAARLAR